MCMKKSLIFIWFSGAHWIDQTTKKEHIYDNGYWLVRKDENWELCTDTRFHKTVPDVTQSQQGDREGKKKK